MKIKFTYSNSIKALVVFGFAVAFYLIMFLLFDIFEVKENLAVNAQCNLDSKDSYKCIFSCNIAANCSGLITERTVVLHSGSISIFDKLQNVSCSQSNVKIDLPNRNYTYDTHFLLFDNNYYGKSEGFMTC